MLRAYLEASRCENYEQLYEFADQVYGINRENSIQKTMRDYFAHV